MRAPLPRWAGGLALAALITSGTGARADVPAYEEDFEVPEECLQRWLCENEKVGASCGADADGAPLVCETGMCGAARESCAVCTRVAVPW